MRNIEVEEDMNLTLGHPKCQCHKEEVTGVDGGLGNKGTEELTLGGVASTTPSSKLLEEQYNCPVKIYHASYMMIDFLYASNAADIARLLVEAEVPFKYETQEIFFSGGDLHKLLREVEDLWGC